MVIARLSKSRGSNPVQVRVLHLPLIRDRFQDTGRFLKSNAQSFVIIMDLLSWGFGYVLGLAIGIAIGRGKQPLSTRASRLQQITVILMAIMIVLALAFFLAMERGWLFIF